MSYHRPGQKRKNFWSRWINWYHGGIVEGEYTYDEQRGEYCHTRKVRWTDKGEWEHPDQYVLKTLADMTPYTDFLKKMGFV